MICRCRNRSAPWRKALSWQPSLVLPMLLVMVGGSQWVLTWAMFFFTSSVYKEEVTYSDRPGYSDIFVPPAEQAEDAAAADQDSDFWHWLLVPQMQRFLGLLVADWVLFILILEPLLLAAHLFIGGPCVDDVINSPVWDAPCRCLRWFFELLYELCCHELLPMCCGCCPCRCCKRRRYNEFSEIGSAPGEYSDDEYDPDSDDDATQNIPTANEVWTPG
mmetsp:Transcript_119177/g.210772  ORF Transcript_119177/g.210772 Transcript_119177/m.210772 type:complete len:218 (-) Transcript_119177:38-691(-)